MARLQGRIVINPKVLTDNRDALAIAYNEAYRMVMEANNFEPMAEPTEEQKQFFADTAYANDPLQLKRTITARIATYDDSVPNPTPEQYQDVVNMLEMVQQAGVIQNQEEEDVVTSTLEDMTEKAGQMEQLQPMGEGTMPVEPGAMEPGAMPVEPGAMPDEQGAMPTEQGAEEPMPQVVDPAMLQQLMGGGEGAAGGNEQLMAQAADKGGSVTDEEYKRLMDTMPPQPRPDDEDNRLAEALPPPPEPEGPTVLAAQIKASKDVDGIEQFRSYDDGKNGPNEPTDDLGYRYVGDIFNGKGQQQASNSTVDGGTVGPIKNDGSGAGGISDEEYNKLMETMPPQPNPDDEYNRLMETIPPQPPKPLTKDELTDKIRQRFETIKSLQMRPTIGEAIPKKSETQFDKDTRAVQELENKLAANQADADRRKEHADGLNRTLDQVADNLNKAGSTPAPEATTAPEATASSSQPTQRQKWDFSGALGKMNAQSVGARSYTDASGKRITEYQPVEGLDAARAIRQSNNSASGRILRMADMAQKNGGVDYIIGRLNDEKTGASVRKNIEKQLAAFDSLRESYEKGGLIQYDNDGNVISAPDGWKERIAAANMLRYALNRRASDSTAAGATQEAASGATQEAASGATQEAAAETAKARSLTQGEKKQLAKELGVKIIESDEQKPKESGEQKPKNGSGPLTIEQRTERMLYNNDLINNQYARFAINNFRTFDGGGGGGNIISDGQVNASRDFMRRQAERMSPEEQRGIFKYAETGNFSHLPDSIKALGEENKDIIDQIIKGIPGTDASLLGALTDNIGGLYGQNLRRRYLGD